jgi:hypothetical protein
MSEFPLEPTPMVRLMRALGMIDKIPVEYLTPKELDSELRRQGVDPDELVKRTKLHMDSIKKTMDEPRKKYCKRGQSNCEMIGCDCFIERVKANRKDNLA